MNSRKRTLRAVALAAACALAAPAAALTQPEAVRYAELGGGFGYLRIPDFGQDTAAAVRDALALPLPPGVRGLLLDLRGSEGGLVSQAVPVVDLFLAPGLIMVYLDGDAPGEGVKLRSKHEDLVRVPVAVLVNHETAGAAELLAGALQDHRRALLVGTRTAGRSAIHAVGPGAAPGADGYTPRFHTPAGHDVQGRGLTPDVVAETAAAVHADPASDPTVLRALEILETGGVRKR